MSNLNYNNSEHSHIRLGRGSTKSNFWRVACPIPRATIDHQTKTNQFFYSISFSSSNTRWLLSHSSSQLIVCPQYSVDLHRRKEGKSRHNRSTSTSTDLHLSLRCPCRCFTLARLILSRLADDGFDGIDRDRLSLWIHSGSNGYVGWFLFGISRWLSRNGFGLFG